jgi:hypothetical protein
MRWCRDSDARGFGIGDRRCCDLVQRQIEGGECAGAKQCDRSRVMRIVGAATSRITAAGRTVPLSMVM